MSAPLIDSAGVPAPIAAQLKAILGQLIGRKGVGHAIVAVESGDGSLRWVGAAGDADGGGTPMQPDTPFPVASVSKMVTAAATLQLHERGIIGLDEPISSYLPERLVAGLHVLQGVDRSSAITVRHLLAHTSGLANYAEDKPRRGGRPLLETMFEEGDRPWSIDDVTRIVRDDLRPHFPPAAGAGRQRARYSDTNYQLLGAIIEHASGRPLHEVFEEGVFTPLGLTETYLHAHPPDGARPASRLFFRGRPLDMPLAMASVAADGGIVSTVHDGFVFMRALTRGTLFEQPETWPMMHARWNRFGVPLDAAAVRAPSWPIEYGLGILRFELPRIFTGMRRLPAVIGHTGSIGSWLFHCPDRDLFLMGTVGEVTSGAVPYRAVPRILRAIA